MNMNKKTIPQEMVAYDFSNLDLQENSKGNCFATECDEPCVCDCDCDGGCDYCDDGGACDWCDNNID
ncbi:MAG: hypothetical protein IKZ55_11255 [Bacteroidales bacterium]|nr:hypothetical protein [Bacteroidales bacterium]